MQVKCKTPKKKTTETEIFAVTSQQQYEKIVNDVRKIVDEDFRLLLEAQTRERDQEEADLKEIEELQSRIRFLQKKMKKIDV